MEIGFALGLSCAVLVKLARHCTLTSLSASSLPAPFLHKAQKREDHIEGIIFCSITEA